MACMRGAAGSTVFVVVVGGGGLSSRQSLSDQGKVTILRLN